MLDSEKTKDQLLFELQETRRQLELLSGGAYGQTQPDDKFYKAFLSSPDMIIISSVSTGRYVEVNDSFARNTGYRREELIGRTLQEFNFFASSEEEQRMMQLLQKQGNFKNEEFAFRVRSGDTQQWLCSAEVIDIGAEKCMVAVATDITARKKIEQALSESEQILAMAFHSSPQAIAITTMKDGRFVEVNRSHELLCGYSRDELIGHTATELNIWNSLEERKRVMDELKTKGHIYDELLTFRARDGKVHTALFSAEIIKIRGEVCMIGSSTDLTEHQQIIEALRSSEEKFTRAFNSSLTAMCLCAVEDSIFLEVNDSFISFTGYSREESLGKTSQDLNLWVSEEEFAKMGKSLQETGMMINQRIRSRTKSGEVRTGLFTAQTFDIGGKKHMILSINDITEQARTAAAIANEATLRRILIRDSKDGIVILHDDGKVYEANHKFCEMLGYSMEEMVNLNVWDWDTQWDRDNLLKQIKAIDEAGDHFETSHKRKDGSVIEVEISTNGAVANGQKLVFCVCRDITQRKQMEKAVRESEEKFAKAFHSGPEITAITTLDEGTILDMNENYTRVTGFSREELLGHKARAMGVWVNSEDRLDMLRTLEKEGKVSGKEYKFYMKSGESRTWLFSAEKITIGGEPCLLCLSIDITDQKLTEARAKEAENLREIDKLRRELLANVSHELRTPLAGIKGFTSMLLDYGKRLKPAEKQEYLENIDKNSDRLVELIEQLLEMSRLGAGMLSIIKKTTDVAQLCEDTIREARVRSTNHRFSLKMPKRLVKIEIDNRRIRQVLDNLIDNAVKYSEPGTEITVSVRKKEETLLFAVSDHGMGIPKEDIPHLFERAFVIKAKRTPGIAGAGLGLSICKGLVEAHGGRIWCESEEGIGTTCFFTLPIKAKPAVEAAAGNKIPPAK
jgi:PAS domain S-box-containing protein